MIKRDELILFIQKTIGEALFEKAEKIDTMANGVQFHGGEDVELVTLGVSLNNEFLEKAVADGSNFSIFHHAFDPRTYNGLFSNNSQKRLRTILKNDMTVVGLHYVLDAHPKIGNNAVIIQKLGAKLGKSLHGDWGFTGTFSLPVSLEKLKKQCEELFGRDIFVIDAGREMVRTIGVVSGAGKPYVKDFKEFEKCGVELYISGETSESIPFQMKEENVAYFLCGHYTTETFGIKALGEEIKKHFKDKVRVEFIDVPNPI